MTVLKTCWVILMMLMKRLVAFNMSTCKIICYKAKSLDSTIHTNSCLIILYEFSKYKRFNTGFGGYVILFSRTEGFYRHLLYGLCSLLRARTTLCSWVFLYMKLPFNSNNLHSPTCKQVTYWTGKNTSGLLLWYKKLYLKVYMKKLRECGCSCMRFRGLWSLTMFFLCGVHF